MEIPETREAPPLRGRSRTLLLAALMAAAIAAPLAAASLDGAGRIVILPYAVSGAERESTIYLTNPSQLKILIHAMYVGAEGTPFAASVAGPQSCAAVAVDRLSGEVVSLSKLCPQLSTADLENFGYVEFRVAGGFDAAPFFVRSVVHTTKGGRFAVEGVPAGALDPGRSFLHRQRTLRAFGLVGEIGSVPAVDKMTHCYLATLGEPKTVTVQLMDYGSGRARPLGSAVKVSLPALTMTKLADVLAQAGVNPGRFGNLGAEFYADASSPLRDDGAALVAGCSVETLATRSEEFRLARTPSPRDGSRTREEVAGETRFEVGPFTIRYNMTQPEQASMSFYMRHEDRARCRLVPSTLLLPWEDPTPWQELRVLDPDGRVVAGGDDVNDTGVFFTGLKNGVAAGENGRWIVEVGWRESASGAPPARASSTFGVRCESTSGVSALLPRPAVHDDF